MINDAGYGVFAWTLRPFMQQIVYEKALTTDPTPYGPKHVLIRGPGPAPSLTPRQDAETPLIRGG